MRFPVCGTADDTLAVQAAIDAGPGIVQLPAGVVNVTSLNLTGRRGVVLQGEGREATQIVPIGTGKNVLDLTGSGGTTLRDFRIHGHDGPAQQATGILVSTTAAYAEDAIIIDNVRVDGTFSISALYVFSVPSSQIYSSQFYNYGGLGIVAIFTGNNFFGAVSEWASMYSPPAAPSDWTIVGTEFHSFANQAAIWIGGASSLRVYGGNASSQYYVVDVNGIQDVNNHTITPHDIIFDGTTFYSDNGIVAPAAVKLGGFSNAITFRNCVHAQPALTA